jgi:hypothetical protein
LNIPFSTYWQHERAELPGGRDYGPDEAERYARRLGVTPEWLLTGYSNGIAPSGLIESPDVRKVPIVGYVGNGAEVHFYAVAQDEFDEVDLPRVAPESAVALEIRCESLGAYFNRWLAFYDSVRQLVSAEMIGELCVVGTEDGRVLIRQIQRGHSNDLFDLVSCTGEADEGVAVAWAALVSSLAPLCRNGPMRTKCGL